jgi:hypothetical protein
MAGASLAGKDSWDASSTQDAGRSADAGVPLSSVRKAALGGGEGDPVLWPSRPGQGRDHAGQVELQNPTTGGTTSDNDCPSMTASASMPPIPQPRTPRPLTMVVCESVPRHTSG